MLLHCLGNKITIAKKKKREKKKSRDLPTEQSRHPCKFHF